MARPDEMVIVYRLPDTPELAEKLGANEEFGKPPTKEQ